MTITCTVQVHGRRTCGALLHRVPSGPFDWAWADESGSTFGNRYPFNPYAELNRLQEIPARIGDYAMLKAEVDLGGTFHQHRPDPTAVPPTPPDPDRPADHCGQPSWLTPSGWLCRVCKEPLA